MSEIFDGWFNFAGNELVNSARSHAYIRELLPHLSVNTFCGDGCGCDHLADFLGEKQYATPLIDDAPWVDISRQESFGFYGVQTLGVVGLKDDSRTATVIESMEDGGWVTGRRRNAKEMRFTVLLTARSEESMDYGEQWLSTVLDGDCEEGCTPSAQLCFLTDCVDPATFTGTTREQTHPLNEWSLNQTTWVGGGLRFNNEASWARLSVRDSCGDVEWALQLRGEAGVTFGLEADGVVGQYVFDGTLQTFYVSTTANVVTLRPVGGTAGMASWTEPAPGTPTPPDEFAEHEDGPPTDGASFSSSWSQFTTLPMDVEIIKVTSVAHIQAGPDDCSREFYRYMRRVACIEGPTLRRSQVSDAGGILNTYDFTLVAEVPYRFGEPVVAAQGPSTNIVEQATPYRVVRLASNLPECTQVSPGPLLDPLQSIVPPPPGPSVSGGTFRAEQLLAEQRRPYAIVIPAETIPQWTSVVPIVSLTAAVDARFVRVRFLPMPIDSIAPNDLDPCSACGSFEIAYMPEGSTLVVDGASRTAYATIGGQRRSANHLLTSVSGTGTPDWPILSCGVGYVCIIDTRDQALTEVKIELLVRE